MTNSLLITQQDLDRLVDGELVGTERRSLIARLEQAPDGWRRCALAYLEAQEFRRSMATIGNPMEAQREKAAVDLHLDAPSPSAVRRGPSSASRWLVLASALMVSFAVGMGAGRAVFLGDENVANTSPLINRDNSPDPPDSVPNPSRDSQPGNAATERKPPAPPVQKSAPRTGEVRVVGLVRIADESSHVSNYVMPVFSGTGLDQEWLKSMPLPYTDEQVRKLKQDGYQVEQRRQLMEVNLADGQNLSIPFGTVNLQYIGPEVH